MEEVMRMQNEQELINNQFINLIARQKELSFINPNTTNDSDAISVMIGNRFKWEPEPIIDTILELLTEINYHNKRMEIEKMFGITLEEK